MKTSIIAGFAATLMMGAAMFAAAAANDYALGVRGDENLFARVVVITPETRWVNVESGETIKFVDAAGQSVVYRFDTTSWAIGQLGDFAPALAKGRQITVYVAKPRLNKTDG